MREAIPPLPQYVFIAWCQLYLLLYLLSNYVPKTLKDKAIQTIQRWKLPLEQNIPEHTHYHRFYHTHAQLLCRWLGGEILRKPLRQHASCMLPVLTSLMLEADIPFCSVPFRSDNDVVTSQNVTAHYIYISKQWHTALDH